MKIGMLFPGYGSQFVGMGKELYDDSRVMQEYFEEAANCLNVNFVKLCFAASDAELARMENAYTSLFLVSSAIAALLKQEGIEPSIIAGYNIGEYSAIHAAGGISFPDGLYLLSKYQAFYQELLETVSVAGIQIVGLPTAQVKELCSRVQHSGAIASIAVHDGLVQHTVMGTVGAIEALRELLAALPGVEIDDMGVEVGLHNALMDPVVLNFKLYLEKVDFKNLMCPLITNADAKLVHEGDSVKLSVIKQIHSPVLWQQSIELLNQCDVVIEVGPGSYLSSMVQAQYPEKKCRAINKMSDIEELRSLLGKQTPVTVEI